MDHSLWSARIFAGDSTRSHEILMILRPHPKKGEERRKNSDHKTYAQMICLRPEDETYPSPMGIECSALTRFPIPIHGVPDGPQRNGFPIMLLMVSGRGLHLHPIYKHGKDQQSSKTLRVNCYDQANLTIYVLSENVKLCAAKNNTLKGPLNATWTRILTPTRWSSTHYSSYRWPL